MKDGFDTADEFPELEGLDPVIGLGQDETGPRFWCDKYGCVHITTKTLNVDPLGGGMLDKIEFHNSLLPDFIECLEEAAAAARKAEGRPY